jgi:hypothetical protein
LAFLPPIVSPAALLTRVMQETLLSTAAEAEQREAEQRVAAEAEAEQRVAEQRVAAEAEAEQRAAAEAEQRVAADSSGLQGGAMEDEAPAEEQPSEFEYFRLGHGGEFRRRSAALAYACEALKTLPKGKLKLTHIYANAITLRSLETLKILVVQNGCVLFVPLSSLL